jgi:TfoX/Sxy family transcriptional regulator of competence genes
MAYNEHLSERVARLLQEKKISFEEKRMFGGMAFMVDDKMCVGVVREDLMVRIDPARDMESYAEAGCRPMDFTGKRMKGFYFIDPRGTDMDSDLEHWVEMALEFNPMAKSSKK